MTEAPKSRIKALWALLNTPSRFDRDPYGGLTNQISHAAVGACFFVSVCCGWFWATGEMPKRYVVAALIVLGYALVIEWHVQGWRGADSLEDTLFVALGVFTLATSVQEMDATWPYSSVMVNVPRLMVSMVVSSGACLFYAAVRMQ